MLIYKYAHNCFARLSSAARSLAPFLFFTLLSILYPTVSIYSSERCRSVIAQTAPIQRSDSAQTAPHTALRQHLIQHLIQRSDSAQTAPHTALRQPLRQRSDSAHTALRQRSYSAQTAPQTALRQPLRHRSDSAHTVERDMLFFCAARAKLRDGAAHVRNLHYSPLASITIL